MIDAETTTIVTLALSAASAIAASASAFGAFWTIRRNSLNLREERKAADEVRENERLLNHAASTLERAFSALMGGNQELAFPPSDRLAWLTSARLILDYKKTKHRISSPLLIQECEGHEEHWRHQFYLKLNEINRLPQGYYATGEIQKSSAVIVHAFSDWPEGKVDEIPVDFSDAVDEHGVRAWWFELRHYLGIL
ncbi:hypothetical protein [Pseudomonas kurunegalensis]|uniref:hypothetical protein n=1 Tax=Pseudomonas kurunegalensis TaxID=485880 RepID=UPI00256FE4E3|nr:hypothetical protein [Pseudomonas kurunegalensis]WJD60580.1 hypothetical protein QQ992_16720 [Pseudomonas kurunegalensis]